VSTRRISKSLLSAERLSRPGPYIVGTAVAQASSISIPAHQIGDMLMIFAHSNGNGQNPGVPAASGTVPAWTTAAVGSPTSFSGIYSWPRAAYFVATATNTTSGSWGFVDLLVAVVVRRATGIGGTNGVNISTTAPAITLSNGTGTSLLFHFHSYGGGSSTVTSINAAPTGYTRLVTGTYSTVMGCVNTKNETTTDGAVTQTATATGFSGSLTVEVTGI